MRALRNGAGRHKLKQKRKKKAVCNNALNDMRKFFSQSEENRENAEAGLEKNRMLGNGNMPEFESRKITGSEGDGSESMLSMEAGTIKEIGSVNWGKEKSFLRLREVDTLDKDCAQ